MSKVDIVYFLSDHNSHYDHEELRYSLRSLIKHVAGVGRVFVIGIMAPWLQNVVHRPETDPYEHNKDANIIRKMMITCQDVEISDPFLFVNDDHFFTRKVHPSPWSFLFFHKGELKASSRHQEYARRLRNTRKLLEERGLPTLNFDVHTPILIHKEKFLQAFATWDWVDLEGPGVVMKSIYGNSWPEAVEDAVYLPDLKLSVRTRGSVAGWEETLAARPCFSTGNYVPRLVWQLLERLYPSPSPFEKESES